MEEGGVKYNITVHVVFRLMYYMTHNRLNLKFVEFFRQCPLAAER